MPEGVVAYFSMEIALENHLPTYSGGLGALAGDTLRAAAGLGVPMVGVTLLHRQGHFTQRLEPDGTQREAPVAWSITDWLEPTEGVCSGEVGLAVSYGIVQDHLGTIDVHSVPGQGATFTLNFPILESLAGSG